MRDCFGNPSSSHATGLRAKPCSTIRVPARAACSAPARAPAVHQRRHRGHPDGRAVGAVRDARAPRAPAKPCGDLLLYGATEHKAVPESLAHWNRLLGTG
jgi:cysteine desulfurase